MRDLLAPARMARRGLFEPAEVTRLVDAARRRTREPRPHAVPADGLRALGRRPPRRSIAGREPAESRPGARPVHGLDVGDLGGDPRRVPAECRGHDRGRGLEGAAARMTGRAGLGAPQDRVAQGDRGFVADGVEDLGPGDGAALGQRAGRGRAVRPPGPPPGAPVGAVAAGQALPQRWRRCRARRCGRPRRAACATVVKPALATREVAVVPRASAAEPARRRRRRRPRRCARAVV